MISTLILALLAAPQAPAPAPPSIYSEQAQRQGIDARVVLLCQADYDTLVIDQCVVERENPAGYGFGEAALKLAATFKLDKGATPRDGVRKGPRRIPVSFNPSKE